MARLVSVDLSGYIIIYVSLAISPFKSCNRILVYTSFHKNIRWSDLMGPQAPILGRYVSAFTAMLGLMHYYVMLHSLIYYFTYTTILCFVCYYIIRFSVLLH